MRLISVTGLALTASFGLNLPAVRADENRNATGHRSTSR